MRSANISHGKAEGGKTEFSLVFALSFLVFLVAATAARFMPRRWRWSVSGDDEGKSIIASARTAANNSLPYAFM